MARSAGEKWLSIGKGDRLRVLRKAASSGWEWRTVALKLEDGRSLVISPTRGTPDAAHAELREWATPAWVLAPNHFHYLGIQDFLATHEGTSVVASEKACPRLASRCAFGVSPHETAGQLREVLPKGAKLHVPAGLANGETWLSLPDGKGRTLVVSDAFFNVEGDVTGFTGFVLRATKTISGLRIGDTFRWLGIGDKAAYRAWMEKFLDGPEITTIVFGHGAVATGELTEKLRALSAERLG